MLEHARITEAMGELSTLLDALEETSSGVSYAVEKAALATIRAALQPKVVSREWLFELGYHLEHDTGDDDRPIMMLAALGVKVGDE